MSKNTVTQGDKSVVETARSIMAKAVAHRFIKDKSPKGLASRVARSLNAAGVAPPAGSDYFTGADVLDLLAKADAAAQAGK
jgi:hypothetical protein